MLVDAHCHVALLSEQQLADAKSSGYTYLATGGTHTENERIVKTKENNFFNVLGVAYSEECNLDSEIEFIIRNKPVAIGEIGLDFLRVSDSLLRKKIESKFLRMISLASQLKIPVVVHSREAESRVLELLDGFKFGVMMHCFSGDLLCLQQCIDRGYVVSIPPQINSRRKEIIKNTPLSNLVVESDAPALGGPRDALHSAELISKFKNLALDDVIFAVNQNAMRFFGLGGLIV